MSNVELAAELRAIILKWRNSESRETERVTPEFAEITAFVVEHQKQLLAALESA